MTYVRRTFLVLLSVFYIMITACSGGGGGSADSSGSDGDNNPTPATIVSIAVTPDETSVAMGSAKQFTATATYSDGSTQDVTNSVTWSSFDTGVATINSAGLATPASVGSSTITASSGDISGTTDLVVSAIALARTGQTTCYNESFTEIACAGTGQDGEFQKGVAWPTQRFTDNGDGTVTDNLTGLIWLKDAGCFPARTWTQALSDANTLASGTCGLTDGSLAGDWRLPNIKDLLSLIDRSLSALVLPVGHPFRDVEDVYWASTSAAPSPPAIAAWQLREAGTMYASSKTWNSDWAVYSYYVWPVRSGQENGTIELSKTGQTRCYDAAGTEISCTGTGQDGALQTGAAWPSPRFSVNADTTVTDYLTGLKWAPDGNIMQLRDPGWDTDGADDGKVKWQHALDYVAKLNTENYLGHHDWRLPNVNELESVINAEQENSATWLNSQGFSNLQYASYYWSSTTGGYWATSAWVVHLWGGVLKSYDKNSDISFPYYVWPVRGGQ